MRRFGWWPFAALAIVIAGCGSNSSAIGGLGDGSVAQDGASGNDGGTGSDDGSLSDATTAGDGANSTNPDGAATDDGSFSFNLDGSFGPDGSVSVNCTAYGGSCSFGASCCSGICDTTTNTCASTIAKCAPASAACAGNTDCCSGACINGQCGGYQCLTIGAACPVAGNACCTGNCTGGKCQTISPGATCVTANNACTSDAQCCSGKCTSGTCTLGSSYCIQTGDICYRANDCCGGICSAPNGNPVTATNPGVCSQPSSGMVNCTGVDGSLCPGGNCGQCCSRLCAPYGPTGVNICQPAQGCRVEGDLCRTSADCCGAPGSGVLGDGEVSCSNQGTTAAVGVCLSRQPDGGGACVPEGDVCHYTASNYTCGVSSATSDCCGPQRPKFDACVLDPFGVPRCNAATGVPGDGGTGCVSTGNACSTATECCTGNPCVVGPGGQLQCSATSCQMSGQTCTTNADCCAGLPCVSLPGSIQGTCSPVTPPPPPPSDGGTPGDAGGVDGSAPVDAGTSPEGGGFMCALYGQSCSALPCCTGTTCISGKCSTF